MVSLIYNIGLRDNMINEFYDVVLVDFSGILPFKLEKENILTRQETVATENLRKFLLDLEEASQYESIYIGADFLETKLFHRLIIEDGLLELLIGTPITLMGHFKEKEKAEQFRASLEKTLNKTIPDFLQPILADSIEVKKVKREIITAEGQKLSKL